MFIFKALENEHEILTNISFLSKAHWGYPQHYFDIWKQELTITSDYISNNQVFTYKINKTIVAYCSLVYLSEDIDIQGYTIEAGYWLEHIFVLPEYLNQGIGRKLFNHAIEFCKNMNIKRVGILSDPNAKGFYEKLGCKYISDVPSNIQGRTTPMFYYLIS